MSKPEVKPEVKPEEVTEPSIVDAFLSGDVDKARELIQRLTIEKTKELLK